MKQYYRSVWISDLHLGNRDSQVDAIYSFLDSIHCDYLYLVGDIVDLWSLKRRWFWPKLYNEVLHKVLKRSRRGAKVIFIPGNHDEFFRDFVGYRFGDVEIRSQAIHETVDGKRLLVVHGDEFDAIVVYHKWLSKLGAWAYDYLIALNRWVNAFRRVLGMPYWSLSGAAKRRVKQAVKYVTNFEKVLSEKARREGVDGVICGHIHQPALRDADGVLYGNSGDWVENCTALVENEFGELELIWWRSRMDVRCVDMADAVALPTIMEWNDVDLPEPVVQSA
ncbi:MAG: UDP-2,3-diacylglucosamine diphosphatase [Phycisphaerae bacterium]|nr:UDP-2,3-diacylglucosamine diphosphatase [Phycisphaerae bacterium]